MHKHIFFSYAFDDKGNAHKLRNAEVAEELKNEGLAWIHLDGNSSLSKKWLEREVSYLDNLIIDALFAEEARPRIIKFENGLLIILRGINLDATSEEIEDMASIRLWIDNSRIISIQKRNFSAVFNVAKKIDAGKKIKTSPEFLYNLIYENLLLISPEINKLNDEMDIVESTISQADHDSASLREVVTSIRRKVAIFKRYILPQKDVLSHLKSHDSDWINDWARRHFQENHDHITHIIEELDEARDRSQIVHEEISNTIADRLNHSMFKISLIASIFMPLGFIAGLFGMNVGGIPGNEDPDGFYITLFFMVAALGLALLLLKRKKWF
ncbi:MAG: zinc transporter ZntB [Rickettsiales bacterium]|nr:zinc transporter ZntB [Rickettsiales bacterium]